MKPYGALAIHDYYSFFEKWDSWARTWWAQDMIRHSDRPWHHTNSGRVGRINRRLSNKLGRTQGKRVVREYLQEHHL